MIFEFSRFYACQPIIIVIVYLLNLLCSNALEIIRKLIQYIPNASSSLSSKWQRVLQCDGQKKKNVEAEASFVFYHFKLSGDTGYLCEITGHVSLCSKTESNQFFFHPSCIYWKFEVFSLWECFSFFILFLSTSVKCSPLNLSSWIEK